MTPNRQPALVRRLRQAVPARLSRGFSLIEVLVASAVFLLIMLAVYQVYMRSLEGHKLGVNQAELIQSTRFGFAEMATRIRSAGYEFDLDGPPTGQANQSDESIEYMDSTAIAIRANYDFASEDFRGREVDYEIIGGGCCPVVTTGNDEILAFALSKDEGDPNQPTEEMTLYLDLDAPRDGIVSLDTGLIEGEETVTIPNVALTDFSDPPYVLYQFTWSDPDASGVPVLERRPLVDNILALEFQYFDEGGNDLANDSGGNPIGLPAGGPNPSSDADPASDERSRRERVRKVKILLKAMTPEPDLRYNDPDDSDPATRKHRKWELVEEVHTFNVGRRGQKDKDTDPPDSVTDVQLCSGQCGMVRVDWSPGPPEDRISDHIVILAECSGGSGPNYDNPLASFIVVSDLDLTVNPEREYAVFDVEDDPDLVADIEVCARVIARDSSGAESELPSDSDNNTFLDPDTSNDYTTIIDYSRSDAPAGGKSSGYDPDDNDWPNALADNDGGLEITTNDTEESYPLANRIEIAFDTPRFVLNRQSTGPGNLHDWTTSESGTTHAALDDDVDAGEICHRIELSPDVAGDERRTPNEELARASNSSRPNVYVFRVSGSDDSNWGPEQADCDPAPGPNCIGEARNFMPYSGNLHAFYSASMSGATFTYSDSSDSAFYIPEGVTDMYEGRYLWTGTETIEPDGELAPVKALTPGEVYYYRVRVVDNCWNDSNRDGVEDDTAGGSDELAAWSTVEDFADEDTWREAAVRISPFYPPLLKRSNAPGERDAPANAPEHDSDAADSTSYSSLNTYALPGYAIPEFVQGTTYVRPAKPTEFYIAKANDSTSELLPVDTGGTNYQGTRILFNSAKRSAPQDTSGSPTIDPTPVGYSWYRLERKLVAGYTAGSVLDASDVNWEAGGGTLVTEFRLSDAGLREYTINRRAEVFGGMNSVLNNSALYLDDTASYYYKLFTAQVSEGEHYDPAPIGPADNDLPDHVADDGITPNAAARYSLGSRGFLYPSPFYDKVYAVDVDPNPANGINATSVDVEIEMDQTLLGDELLCLDVKSARLLAYDYDTDQFLGSSDWLDTGNVTGSTDCDLTFTTTYVEDALRTYPERARFRVELSDIDETLAANGGADWDKQPRGARVRSDLVGEAGDYELGTTCGADCGVLGGAPARIFTEIADDQLQTEDGDRVLAISLPIDSCNTEDFSLLQLDLVLDRGGIAMPRFISASMSGLRSGTLTLPEPEFEGEDGANYRLRWFEGSFCDDSGVCEFPVVEWDADAVELRLRFAGAVCAPIRLEGFNFRVLVDVGAGLQELLCSSRGEFAPDAVTEADEPDYYCTTAGTQTDDCGRGPALNAEPCGQNPDCAPACLLGVCPSNSDFTSEPDSFLEDDAVQGLNSIVRIEQDEDCSEDCALTLTEIIGRFECQSADRDCSIVPLPGFISAELVHQDDTRDALPAPSVDRDPTDHIQLTWSGLSSLEVLPGETFGIEMLFDGSMIDTEATTWHLQFGSPLDAITNCDWVPVAPETGIDIPN